MKLRDSLAENKSIRLQAAVDANTHQEVGIMQIVNLFEDEENFDRLRACRTEQEVLDLIDRTNAAA